MGCGEEKDMGTIDSPDEVEALAKLREYELELDRQLEWAREQAKAQVEQARQEAALLREQAEAELEEELTRFRGERALELERALTTIREETERRVETLREQAGANRERALALLLARVLGRDAS